MIRHITVDGFKTLDEFKMELRPGLNILVGPNGSGKTNIISFFEFLGFLQSMNVADAINRAGGAGSIFRKIGEHSYKSTIRSEIIGIARLRYKLYIYYKYSFVIGLRESGESIVYSQQRLQLKFRTVDSEARLGKDYDLDIERNADGGSRPKAKVTRISEKTIGLFYGLRLRPKHRPPADELKIRLEHILANSDPDGTIVSSMRFIDRSVLRALSNDIKGGQTYNIEPSKAKIADDSSKKPGISKDGSGLYSTLYAVQQIEKLRARKNYLLSSLGEIAYGKDASISKILEYAQLANEWISKIEVLNYPFDRQLEIRISVSGKDKATILPLSAMSDGTVKWIVLITLILTNPTMFSIEEPENYLHPLMLSEIISIMRTYTKKERLILMSTHSETLLNHATPDEIIVVSYKDGKTTAKRVSNGAELTKEIRDTGFGLGYYYLSGSFDNE